jgi:hypothetical protein
MTSPRAGIASPRTGIAPSRAGIASSRTGIAPSRTGIASGFATTGVCLWSVPVEDILPSGFSMSGLQRRALDRSRKCNRGADSRITPPVSFLWACNDWHT